LFAGFLPTLFSFRLERMISILLATLVSRVDLTSLFAVIPPFALLRINPAGIQLCANFPGFRVALAIASLPGMTIKFAITFYFLKLFKSFPGFLGSGAMFDFTLRALRLYEKNLSVLNRIVS
jgi:hypothetical protein